MASDKKEQASGLTLMWKIWIAMVSGGALIGALIALALFLFNPAGREFHYWNFALLPAADTRSQSTRPRWANSAADWPTRAW